MPALAFLNTCNIISVSLSWDKDYPSFNLAFSSLITPLKILDKFKLSPPPLNNIFTLNSLAFLLRKSFLLSLKQRSLLIFILNVYCWSHKWIIRKDVDCKRLIQNLCPFSLPSFFLLRVWSNQSNIRKRMGFRKMILILGRKPLLLFCRHKNIICNVLIGSCRSGWLLH